MTDILAGFGLAQLRRFDSLKQRRLDIVKKYDEALIPLGIKRLNHIDKRSEGNGHLYLMRIDGLDEEKRNALLSKFAEAGISCNVHFKPLPMHTAYKNLGFDIKDYPNSYNQYKNEISLPLHTLLDDGQVEYVCEKVKRTIR